MRRIIVCGLGPGGTDRLTEASAAALAGDAPVYLRTARHPSADRAVGATSFDALYDRAETFDEVYDTIADELVAAAEHHERVVYAVPGSPLVLERSVRNLLARGTADPGLDVEVLPALSFLDEAWARLGVDPIDDGVRLVDGHRFAVEAADQRGPLLVAHAHADWVLSDIKLAIDAGPEQRVIVLQALGTADERVVELAWPDLDRAVPADHLTTLYLPEVAAPVGAELARSVEMMGRLRRDCPWDRSQDHHSLRRFLIEEAYEVVEAIDRLPVGDDDGDGAGDGAGDAAIELEEELGDLWFQILFHAELAAEAGWFTLADVASTLTAKMIRRHPHVYGDADASATASVGGWEQLKAAEKARASAMDDIPAALPALARAEKTLKRAAGAGAPADHGQLAAVVESLLPDGSDEREVGLAMLAVVERARSLGVAAEEALRRATVRAASRFRQLEAATGDGSTTGVIPGAWVRG
ncbi:MAG: MazG nucleotide pyrophosphohydrolase domain-containing protein [Actinomycetota bacterium]